MRPFDQEDVEKNEATLNEALDNVLENNQISIQSGMKKIELGGKSTIQTFSMTLSKGEQTCFVEIVLPGPLSKCIDKKELC